MTKEVIIIPFDSKYIKDFSDLNIAWLEKYFVVEPHDSELLNTSEKLIINNDGYIFFAKIDNQIIGTVALMKIANKQYELGKMAVDPQFQGMKVGHKLMQQCISLANTNNWEKLILYSNTKLENAIHLYKKHGFKEIKLEESSPYLRSNIKMELIFNH